MLGRRMARGTWVICLLLIVLAGGVATGGCARHLGRASQAVWNAPEPEVEPGSALATAQAFLEASLRADWEDVDSLYLASRPGRIEGLREIPDETGAWVRYRLVSSESGTEPADWPNYSGGPVVYVWAVVFTERAGDLEVGVALAREGGKGRWGLCYFSRDALADNGLVGPPGFDLPVESLVPLASSDQRAVRLDECDDAVLEAALAWEASGRGDLPIVVSPKIELAYVVAGLTGEAPEFCGSAGALKTPLGKQALQWFRDYRDHPAVTAMSYLERGGFRYDAVSGLMLCFSDPPELQPVFPISDYLAGRSCGLERAARERRLLEAVELMRRFAVEADLAAYMDAKREDYAELVATVRANVSSGLPTVLEEYYGAHNDAYVVIVSGLSGNYGQAIVDGEWSCLAAVVVPSSGDASWLQFTVLHEWSHSFVNPLVAGERELVESCAGLFDPISSSMAEQAYGTWETALNEHIIRAVTARFLARSDPARAEQLLALDEQKGFVYVRPLYDRLAEYEANRDDYPTFASFLPRLLDALGKPDTTGA